jgi:hypothetical protein
MTTYTIQINEEQRLILQYALDMYAEDVSLYPQLTERYKRLEEARILRDMTKDLPHQNEGNPLHGFCL